MESAIIDYVGRVYTFDDNAQIKIVYVKCRDSGWVVMYEITYPGSLPQRLIMPEDEFIGAFGHLFFSNDDL
jgi:hypothetical protein